jgi:hypothetical protein
MNNEENEEYLLRLSNNIEAQIKELNDLEAKVLERRRILGDSFCEYDLLRNINAYKLKLSNMLTAC